MSAWLPLALPLLAALAILAVLGLPAALALRLRGFAIAIVAIPAGFAVLALAPILSGIAHLRWSVIPAFAFAAILALVLVVLRRWLGAPRRDRTAPRPPRVHRLWVPIGSAAIGGAAIATTLVLSIKSADAISQTYDAIFHLNAVRLILETGNASPFAMDLSNPGHPGFYPTLWHGYVVLIAQLSGASIPLATNAALFTVCAVVWPIGAVALGRAIAGPSVRTTLVSGIIAAAFPNFPLSLAGFGVLYPNLLSTALIPFVLVAALQLLGLGQARRSDPLAAGTRWLLLLGALGTAILAHPNAIHVLLLWLAAPIITAAIRATRGGRVPSSDGTLQRTVLGRGPRIGLAAAGLLLFLLAVVVAWHFGRTSDHPWGGSHETPFGAVLDAVGSTPRLEGHNWPVTVLIVLGAALIVFRRRQRWLLGVSLALISFYIIADGFRPADWRTFFLSPWYNDPWRLAALVPLGAIPLAVAGASTAAAIATSAFRRVARMFGGSRVAWHRTFWGMFGAAFLLATTQGAGAFAGVNYVSSKYEFDSSSRLLTPDERTLIERLPEHVPGGAVIADNPWNGGALAYALADRRVLVPHAGGNYDPRITALTGSIDRGSVESCRAAKDLNVEFVLDFGREYVFEGTKRALPYLGISGVERSDVLTEVDRQGEAVLYKITGCKN